MDFYVYDNIITYNKRNVFDGNPNTRLEIKRIELPENGSFWFWTDMLHARTNVNIQKRYVHIHKGIQSTNQVKFKKDPVLVGKSDLVYNPKERRVEVRNSIFPWKKPYYAKSCKYYGAELPSKKMTCSGDWFYNASNNTVHFIINYYPQKIKFHWEEEEDANMVALMAKKNELELKVEQAELELKNRSLNNSDVLSDL